MFFLLFFSFLLYFFGFWLFFFFFVCLFVFACTCFFLLHSDWRTIHNENNKICLISVTLAILFFNCFNFNLNWTFFLFGYFLLPKNKMHFITYLLIYYKTFLSFLVHKIWTFKGIYLDTKYNEHPSVESKCMTMPCCFVISSSVWSGWFRTFLNEQCQVKDGWLSFSGETSLFILTLSVLCVEMRDSWLNDISKGIIKS